MTSTLRVTRLLDGMDKVVVFSVMRGEKQENVSMSKMFADVLGRALLFGGAVGFGGGEDGKRFMATWDASSGLFAIIFGETRWALSEKEALSLGVFLLKEDGDAVAIEGGRCDP